MIRVNLLASAEGAAAARGGRPAWLPAAGAAAALAAGLLAAAWWTWALRAEAAGVARELQAAGETLRGLAPALGRVRAAEASRADLLAHVDLLERLHARRGTALRTLRRLSRALPDGLWLSEVREEPGHVVVRGRAADLAAVSDYVAALEAGEAFGAPVELVDSRRAGRPGGRQVVSFEARLSLPAEDGP